MIVINNNKKIGTINKNHFNEHESSIKDLLSMTEIDNTINLTELNLSDKSIKYLLLYMGKYLFEDDYRDLMTDTLIFIDETVNKYQVSINNNDVIKIIKGIKTIGCLNLEYDDDDFYIIMDMIKLSDFFGFDTVTEKLVCKLIKLFIIELSNDVKMTNYCYSILFPIMKYKSYKNKICVELFFVIIVAQNK